MLKCSHLHFLKLPREERIHLEQKPLNAEHSSISKEGSKSLWCSNYFPTCLLTWVLKKAGPNTGVHLIFICNSLLSTQLLAYWFSYFLSYSKHSSKENNLFILQDFSFLSLSSLLTFPTPPSSMPTVYYTHWINVTNFLVCLVLRDFWGCRPVKHPAQYWRYQ